MFFITRTKLDAIFPAEKLIEYPDSFHFRELSEIDIQGELLLISRETGGWCILSREEELFFRDFKISKYIHSAQEKLVNNKILLFLHLLHLRGLIAFPHDLPNHDLQKFNMIQRPFKLTFMLSDQCGLACRYCYLDGDYHTESHTLDEQIAKAAIRFALSQDTETIMIDFGEINRSWPLITKLVDFIRNECHHTKQVVFLVQTNGIGLKPERVDYLKKNDFFVGISLDGPPEIHDQNRVNKYGKGTYKLVEKNLRRIQNSHIPYIILTTITQSNWDRAFSLLEYFRAHEMSTYAFKPIIQRGRAEGNWSFLGISADQYIKFLHDEFDYALNQNDLDLLDEVAIKYIFRALGDVRGWHNYCPTGYCNKQSELLFINPEGYVYPCPRFGSNWDSKYRIAKLSGDPSLLKQNHDQNHERLIPWECNLCGWKAYCAGGCAIYNEERDPSCSGYQEIYKNIFSGVFPTIRKGRLRPSSKVGNMEVFDQNIF